MTVDGSLIILQSAFESLMQSNGSVSDAVETLLGISISPEDLFMALPIEESFVFCQLYEDIDDDVIENVEVFSISFTTGNENDVFNSSDSNSESVEVSIFDNDGMYIVHV